MRYDMKGKKRGRAFGKMGIRDLADVQRKRKKQFSPLRLDLHEEKG
jgi:hypothetical protein